MTYKAPGKSDREGISLIQLLRMFPDDASACKGIDRPHTNGMESFRSGLKRGHDGVYHKMSPKHLDRYVTGFSGRHNIRSKDTADRMGQMVAGMVGKCLRYSDLIAHRGLASGAKSVA